MAPRHLLVIGGQRCGTTGLVALLDAHPEIAMAQPARPEPKVFMSDELAARGLAWYELTYFAHVTTETLLGEKSTSYIEDAGAAGRAWAVLGEAEIVVQLRDPVQRAISNWRFSTQHGVEDRSLKEAFTENLDGPRDWDKTKTSVSPFAYLERGRYSVYLQPWFDRFPGHVHVRFLEDHLADPSSIGDLYAALGVDPTFRPPDSDKKVNESTGRPPRLDGDLEARVRHYFAASDAALSERLGRPLPWPTAARPDPSTAR
jgi:hypothetical protein